MSNDLIEPEPGVPEPEPDPQPVGPGAAPPETGESPPPVPTGADSNSGDELTAFLAHPRPDPLLGEFVEESDRPRRRSGSSSADLLESLRVSTERARTPVSSSDSVSGSQGDDEPAAGAYSWTTVLLASYASAVTLALIWVLWTGRGLPAPDPVDNPPTGDTPGDPGVRSDRSRWLNREAVLKKTKVTTLGKAVRLGEVEVTPLAVERGPIVLERRLTSHSLQRGGGGALGVILKIRNVSKDEVFAPLDEAFVRDRTRSSPDSWIDGGPGSTPIPLYPLSVQSEWTIVGQRFVELGPGEEAQTTIFSAPDTPLPLPESLTLIVRLRTGVGQTETLGVRFKGDEVADVR